MDHKIILFSNSSNNIVNLRHNLIYYLSKEKFNLTICVPECNNNKILLLKKKYNFELLIIKNDRFSVSVISNLIFCLKVFNNFKKNKYNLIITFTIKPNILVSLTNLFFKIKIINVITGLGSSFLNEGFLKRLIYYMYRFSLKKSDLVIFQNDNDKKIFLEKKIIKEKNSKVIFGSGVDTSFYNYNPKKFNNNNIKYLFAGRLIKDKGILELLKAFQTIIKYNKGIKLFLAGDIDKGNPSKISENFKDKYKSENIIFVGNLTNLKDYIIDCDYSILLSYREGISNFLLESAALGNPLIATNVPGCREIVNMDNGFLCEPKNIDDILSNINKSMNISNNEYQKLSKKSRQKVLQNFDNKIVIIKFVENIKNLLNNNL